MQRIKFVLWERYRAWWGAHQLNEDDPFLIDRMKAEEEEKARPERLSKLTKDKIFKLKIKRKIQFKKREKRREREKNPENLEELEAVSDAEALAEFQRLAAGGRPEVKLE
jgi:hypothetical protein